MTTPSIAELAAAVTGPDKPPAATALRAAARLMTLLEDEPHRLAELLHVMHARASSSSDGSQGAAPGAQLVLGVTGPPGSGKSTLADALISQLRRRHPQRKIGVIAVDPSSPLTQGALLGDRIRMMDHATDPMVFIRSLASRGHLGGLSLGVGGVSRVMQLMGCDPLLLETVGVGQNEVEVMRVADLVMVVLSPGQGDGTQMLKAGLLEIGDLFVVNKADLPGAEALQQHVLSMLTLREAAGSGPAAVHACSVSALSGAGVPELLDQLEALATERHAAWQARREARAREEVRRAILAAAEGELEDLLQHPDLGRSLVERVLAEGVPIDEVARDLLRRATGASA